MNANNILILTGNINKYLRQVFFHRKTYFHVLDTLYISYLSAFKACNHDSNLLVLDCTPSHQSRQLKVS